MDSPPERFLADAMLGRLARWLRILGYDTVYERALSDAALIERTLDETRWLLTRDRDLAQRNVLRGRHTLISSDDLEGQLRQLHRDLQIGLDVDDQDHRCAECNVRLTPLSPTEAGPLVPPYVAESYRHFLHCPHCRRVFWPGTHWENLHRRLRHVMRVIGHGHDPG
jgi:uncharacterized protein